MRKSPLYASNVVGSATKLTIARQLFGHWPYHPWPYTPYPLTISLQNPLTQPDTPPLTFLILPKGTLLHVLSARVALPKITFSLIPTSQKIILLSLLTSPIAPMLTTKTWDHILKKPFHPLSCKIPMQKKQKATYASPLSEKLFLKKTLSKPLFPFHHPRHIHT